MTTQEFFEWVLTHPGRKKAFGDMDDISIVMHSDRLMKRCEGTCLHLIVDAEDKPIVALWCTEHPEKKDLEIHQLLGYRGSMVPAIRAWQQTYPEWTVSGRRLRSGKAVKHSVKDFCKK
jgi:hypothetical protein